MYTHAHAHDDLSTTQSTNTTSSEAHHRNRNVCTVSAEHPLQMPSVRKQHTYARTSFGLRGERSHALLKAMTKWTEDGNIRACSHSAGGGLSSLLCGRICALLGETAAAEYARGPEFALCSAYCDVNKPFGEGAGESARRNRALVYKTREDRAMRLHAEKTADSIYFAYLVAFKTGAIRIFWDIQQKFSFYLYKSSFECSFVIETV